MIKLEKVCKVCKICGEKRFANTSWCYTCYCKIEREKKEKKEKKAKIKLEKKQNTKKYKNEIKKKLHKMVWKLMSEYIRRKYANSFGIVKCYTCNTTKHWKEMNAGHYKHGKLDFDERNLKPQCLNCNHFNSGRLDVYCERLVRENSIEWLDSLIADAWKHKGYEIDELLLIEKELKEKIKKIEGTFISY